MSKENIQNNLRSLAKGGTSSKGSDTLAWFRFQADVTARYCLDLLSEGNLEAVFCELGDDFALIFANGPGMIVSVKHREKKQGNWPPAELIEKVIVPLFKKWMKLGMSLRFRFSTNASISKDLLKTITNPEEYSDEAHGLAKRIVQAVEPLSESEAIDQATRFIEDLSIECELPGKSSIADVNINSRLRPLLRRNDIDESCADKFYDSLVEIIEDAMRDSVSLSADVVKYSGKTPRLLLDYSRQIGVERRVIIREQLRRLLYESSLEQSPLLAKRKPGSEDQSSNLEKKLKRGGFGATTINSAKELRAAWAILEEKYRSDTPYLENDIDDIYLRILDIASEAEIYARIQKSEGELDAMVMHQELKRNAKVGNLERETGVPLDDRHLMGLAYHLTDKCYIWWSEQFDLELEVG